MFVAVLSVEREMVNKEIVERQGDEGRRERERERGRERGEREAERRQERMRSEQNR